MRARRHGPLACYLALVAVASCAGPDDKDDKAATTGAGPAPPAAPAAGPVEYQGIRFTLDRRVAATATPAQAPACPVLDPRDKPAGIAPAHVAFRFDPRTGEPAALNCSVPDFQRAGLYVFSADGYRRELRSAAASLAGLQQRLAARALAPGDQLPFVPFVDASFALAERATFIDFDGGSGLLVLAELSIEPDTLGDDLVFIFQGLSRDRSRYVLAIFPARSAAAATPFPIDPQASIQELTAAFEPYRRKVARALSRARDQDFSPRPSWLRAMLGSLQL